MSAEREVLKLLHQEFSRAKISNPRYSMRGFAKRLGISSSSITEILNGKRKITYRQTERLLRALLVSPDRQRQLLNRMAEEHTKRISVRWLKKTPNLAPHVQEPFSQIDLDLYQTMSEWYYFAILSLIETTTFQSDPTWISERLNISVRDARTALERLDRLGMILRDPQTGEYRATGKQYRTPTDIADLSIRKGHFQNLDLARQSLETHPVEARDFTAMTMAVDPARLANAKKMILSFQYALSDYLEGGEKKEVFRLCIQLFPLTQSPSPNAPIPPEEKKS